MPTVLPKISPCVGPPPAPPPVDLRNSRETMSSSCSAQSFDCFMERLGGLPARYSSCCCHQVGQRLAAGEAADIAGDLVPAPPHHAGGPAGIVRRHDHIRQ